MKSAVDSASTVTQMHRTSQNPKVVREASAALVFVGSATAFFLAFRFLAGCELNIAILAAQATAWILVVCATVSSSPAATPLTPRAAEWKERTPPSTTAAVSIVLLNAAFSLAAAIWIAANLDIPTEAAAAFSHPRRLLVTVAVLQVVTAQVGGWVIQTVACYLLGALNGGSGSVRDYARIVGLSYAPYLVASVVAFIVNPVIFSPPIPQQALVSLTPFHELLGKTAELASMSSVALLLRRLERFSWPLSITVGVAPGFLMLLSRTVWTALIG